MGEACASVLINDLIILQLVFKICSGNNVIHNFSQQWLLVS